MGVAPLGRTRRARPRAPRRLDAGGVVGNARGAESEPGRSTAIARDPRAAISSMSARKPKDVDEEPWTRRTASRASVGPARRAKTDASPPGTASERTVTRVPAAACARTGSGRRQCRRGGRAGDDTDEYGEEPAWVGGEEVEDAENKARERGLGAQALGFLALPRRARLGLLAALLRELALVLGIVGVGVVGVGVARIALDAGPGVAGPGGG